MPFDELDLILGQSDLSEAAMRVLELKGDLPRRVRPRFDMSIQALDLAEFPYRFSKRQVRYTQSITQAAVAAQHSQFLLGPPAGFLQSTGCWVRRITFLNPSAAAEEFAFGLGYVAGFPGLLATRTGSPSDDRALPGRSAFTLAAGAAVASILDPTTMGLRFVEVAAGQSQTLETEYFMTGRAATNPGNLVALYIEVTQLNLVAGVSIEWEERQLVTSEQVPSK